MMELQARFWSLLVLGVVAGGGARSTFGAEPRPNILWVTCEDTSPTLGCFGDSFAHTPNLDGLARRSVRYTNAYATAPVCSPSRACLITGLYATTLGNSPLRCAMPIPPSFKAYAAYLRAAGYFTSNNVKTDYNLRDERAFVAAAWDRCDKGAHWRERKGNQPFFCVFNVMYTHQSNASVNPWPQFERMARQNLKPEERSDPARVPLPPYYPDTPLARRTMARYYDCVTMMDKEAGRILRELDADGLADDTIVFFFPDHGMGMPRGKRTLYDSGLHVPLIIHFPKKYAHLAPAMPGESVDRLVSFVDFAPTVLSLAGVPVPEQMQGLPFLGPKAATPRQYVYGARDRVDEAIETSRSVRDGKWLYLRNYRPHLSWMQPEGYSDQSELRRELRRLAGEGKLNPDQMTYASPRKALEELYDTTADPYQVHNLAAAAEHKDVLERMRQLHRDWVLSTRDLGFVPEQQLLERVGGQTPYEFGRDTKAYPLERILATADLVGRSEALQQLIERLGDSDPTVRYWALVGLRAAGGDAVQGRDAIVRALADPSVTVRIEAAGVLVAIDDAAGKDALRLLADTLSGHDANAAVHAGRTLELLGQRARPVLDDIKTARDRLLASPGAAHGSPLGFALEAALNGLGEGPHRASQATE